ncbi:hypothetical protein E5288_WYG022511 [Bos mutus]|uniref:Uncharacterized protein n=1 Tax=Bos mutus TaxID=72004 RepID=A0A6B0RJ11_9CETA|nr:hypothetical protein [Bos mutus]
MRERAGLCQFPAAILQLGNGGVDENSSKSPRDSSCVLCNVVMFVFVLVLTPSPESLVLSITCIRELATSTAANILH